MPGGQATGYQRAMTLVVDGYNVLRSSSLYRTALGDPIWDDDFSGDPLNPARQRLLTDVSSYAVGNYRRTIVVFDGAGNESSKGDTSQVAGLEVVFSPYGISADSLIEEYVYHALEEGDEVVVVSSDATVQTTVFRGKVTRMSAEGFAHEISYVREDIEELAAPSGKNSLAARVDAETRAQLKALLKDFSSKDDVLE
jgi:predicted RNA-binding protein with PIN domain